MALAGRKGWKIGNIQIGSMYNVHRLKNKTMQQYKQKQEKILG
jgi:hypothetical protein